MALRALVDSPVRADTATELHELQGRIKRMQGTRLDTRSLPTAPELSRLLPGGALQAGGSYSVLGSTALAMSLMAGPSAAGTWCAVIGLPSFGVEAAASMGIDLERLVLVPQPGPDWLTVTAAMADVAGVLITAPPGRIAPSDAARLAARLRQREAALIVLGSWPQSDATLRVTESSWSGLGAGHGHLRHRRLTVSSMLGQGAAGRPRTAHLTLPLGSTEGRTAPLAGSGLLDDDTVVRLPMIVNR
ncbi:hypothetical protein ITJ66_09060 [Plantibacter sp. VKM Ac-2885]|uniref:hypothetical protein n=1 Tax=Plantibacter sp. VKM Ac-2885 TaxID=2783828 RepID=UPI00188AB4F4|nr:hypothetical protein [Plantibacter sp. VKM Ac-2885]MBF4512635.1 hypothetical protein [Plantibacter sp. VKM Ac-2885]